MKSAVDEVDFLKEDLEGNGRSRTKNVTVWLKEYTEWDYVSIWDTGDGKESALIFLASSCDKYGI